jgi:hypothetical protein
MGRAIGALWIVCAGVIAWVWLRPLHEGSLPAPVVHGPRKPRPTDPSHGGVAQPEDEPVAEDPTATPVQSGPPEMLSRHDLETAMGKVEGKVMQCRDAEPFTGVVNVKMVIAKSGNVQSLSVVPPQAPPTQPGTSLGTVAPAGLLPMVPGPKMTECVKRALRGLSFPRFRGTYLQTIEWTYPFLFTSSAPLPR